MEIYTIDIGIDPFIMGPAFNEFSDDIDYLDYIGSPFSEAVNDRGARTKNTVKGTIRNTIDTTGDLAVAYDDITSANAKLIKSFWDVFASALKLITKSISFIISKLANIPAALNNLIIAAGRIPEKVMAKIRGDIQLYITINDIEAIYNQMIIYNIDTFISTTSALSEGDLWGTMFKKKEKKGSITLSSSNNDIKLFKKLDKIYDRLKSVQFIPTTINMKDKTNLDIYFRNKKAIKFKTLEGKLFQGSYLEALSKLVKDLNERKSDLSELATSIGEKYDQTQANQTFAKLNKMDQETIVKGIRMISKVVALTGSIVKHVIQDTNTIQKKMKKIS